MKAEGKRTLVDFSSHTCPMQYKAMICLEEQYFSINKILLLAIGLWPYEQSKLTRLQFIFLCLISTTIIIVQVTKYFYKIV